MPCPGLISVARVNKYRYKLMNSWNNNIKSQSALLFSSDSLSIFQYYLFHICLSSNRFGYHVLRQWQVECLFCVSAGIPKYHHTWPIYQYFTVLTRKKIVYSSLHVWQYGNKRFGVYDSQIYISNCIRVICRLIGTYL